MKFVEDTWIIGDLRFSSLEVPLYMTLSMEGNQELSTFYNAPEQFLDDTAWVQVTSLLLKPVSHSQKDPSRKQKWNVKKFTYQSSLANISMCLPENINW